MDRVAIVYYQRDEQAKKQATELSSKLRSFELRSELFEVASASAHELIFFDAIVLAGPLHFSRLHGLALIKAVFGYRPVALLVTGSRDPARVLRLLPGRMRGEVPVFAIGTPSAQRIGLDPLVTWLRAMIGYSGYRSIAS